MILVIFCIMGSKKYIDLELGRIQQVFSPYFGKVLEGFLPTFFDLFFALVL